MFNLKNKKVIITGATGGIGNSLVECFIKHEARVLATGTNEEKLKLISSKYGNVLTNKFDISNHDEIENFIENSSKVSNNTSILPSLEFKIEANSSF